MQKQLQTIIAACFVWLLLAGPALAQAALPEPAFHNQNHVPQIKAGLQAQTLGDIIISEPRAEAIAAGDLYLHLPKGLYWATRPDVTVTQGDLTIESIAWDSSDQNLIITVEDYSSMPSTITVSNITVTSSRHLPAGPIEIKIGGPAINAAYHQGIFNAWTVSAKVGGHCVTPPPSRAHVVANFQLDQMVYHVNDVQHNLTVAPFVEQDVVYLPFRALAKTLGVKENHVLWDSHTGTLTLLKSERVVQAQINQRHLLINGVLINTSTQPLVQDGHIMLPLDWITPMFGADVDHQPPSKAITIISH